MADASPAGTAQAHPQVLIVEDDPVTRLLVQRILQARGYQVTTAATAEDGLELLAATFFPLIILDLRLPGIDGLEFCRRARQMPLGDRHYILLGTADDRIEDLENILAAGADDYMSKPYEARLFSIRLAVAERKTREIAKRKELEDQLRFVAEHDALTGLLNRAQLPGSLSRAMGRSGLGNPGAILYLDLDNFKVINDTLGHAAGDQLLVQIAGLLRLHTRAEDLLVRFGGDEFVVVLYDTDLEGAKMVAGRVKTEMDALVFSREGKDFRVTASIGLVPVKGSATVETLLARADAACYAAKARGRNQVAVYRPEDSAWTRLVSEINWAADIRQALKEGRLPLWFQPVVRLGSRAVAFHEVLVRYQNRDGEIIAPGAFLPALERAGLAFELDRYVLERSFQIHALHPERTLSINLSGKSLGDARLPPLVLDLKRKYAVDPARIVLEITETAVVNDLPAARERIQLLAREGFRFALDDFGAGVSSLRYLQNLPVSLIKIDGAFVERLNLDPLNLVIVRAVCEVASLLRLETVAEFVPDEAVARQLAALGVTYGQGFYFGKPSPTLVP